MLDENDLDGQEKTNIFKIGVKGVRGWVSTFTIPNIMSIAALR